MLGTNAIQKQVRDDGSRLYVHEMFYTLQGEGPSAGTPAIFVRLSGCNLACTFCDTEFEDYSWKPSVDELVQAIKRLSAKTRLIVLTGGEPMRQNIAPLCESLLREGYEVEVETSGTLWFSEDLSVYTKAQLFEDRLRIIVSPKTPKVNPLIEQHAYAWKYVVTEQLVSKDDGLPVGSTQRNDKPDSMLARPPKHVLALRKRIYVQPCDYMDEQRNKESIKRTVEVALAYGYKLSLQTHKIIGVA